MREADKIKAKRSYTVSERWNGQNQKELYVKGEPWTTDYGPAHQATPDAAIAYEVKKTTKQIEELQKRLTDLGTLRQNEAFQTYLTKPSEGDN